MKSAFRFCAISAVTMLGGAAALMASTSGQAQPGSPITFIDGGYSEHCAAAARNPEVAPRVVITGSRNPLSGIQLCTLAIQQSGVDRVNTAANYNNRGVLHFAAGNNDAALSDFTEAARMDDTLVFAHINRGNLLNLREQWAEAIAAFDRAIELGIPPGPGSTGNAADLSESSKAWHSRAVRELARAHFNRGIAHENLQRFREAYVDYLRASELAPDWEDPQRELQRFEVVR